MQSVETFEDVALAKPEFQVKPPHGSSNTTAIQQDNRTGRNLWFLENKLTDLDQRKQL